MSRQSYKPDSFIVQLKPALDAAHEAQKARKAELSKLSAPQLRTFFRNMAQQGKLSDRRLRRFYAEYEKGGWGETKAAIITSILAVEMGDPPVVDGRTPVGVSWQPLGPDGPDPVSAEWGDRIARTALIIDPDREEHGGTVDVVKPDGTLVCRLIFHVGHTHPWACVDVIPAPGVALRTIGWEAPEEGTNHGRKEILDFRWPDADGMVCVELNGPNI